MANEEKEHHRTLPHSPLSRFAKFLDAVPTAEFTRSELHRLILDKVDTSVPDSVIEAIFDECDVDNNGLVSVKELFQFIEAIDENGSWTKRIVAVGHEVAHSTTFWAFVIFAIASFIGLAFNVQWRLENEEDPSFNYDFMNNVLLVFGSYAFVGQVVDTTKKEQKLVERAKDKILLFVKSADKTVKVEEEMVPRDFYSILERGGLHIPAQTFKTVFADIDEDDNGTLSFNEIKAYAMARERRGKLSALSFFLIVMKKCMLNVDYWLQWGWTVARYDSTLSKNWFALQPVSKCSSLPLSVASCTISVMNVITSSNADNWAYKIVLHVDGASYAIFSVCALLQHRLNYKEAKRTAAQFEEIKRMLLGQAITVGSRELANGETSIAQMESAIRTSFEAKSETAMTACRILFEKADGNGVAGESDGKLDFLELYDALMQAGFVFDVEVLRSIFDKADTNHDGQIELDEFVDCILSFDAAMTVNQKRLQSISTMTREADFWVANFEVLGSFSLLPGNYVNSKRSRMNWFFASDLAWFIPAVYEAYRICSVAAGNHDALAYGKVNFQRVVLGALCRSDHMHERQARFGAESLKVRADCDTCRIVSVGAGNFNQPGDRKFDLKRVAMGTSDSDDIDESHVYFDAEALHV